MRKDCILTNPQMRIHRWSDLWACSNADEDLSTSPQMASICILDLTSGHFPVFLIFLRTILFDLLDRSKILNSLHEKIATVVKHCINLEAGRKECHVQI